jgi:hypothetical protein
MNTHKLYPYALFALMAVIILLLSACQPATLTPGPQPTQPPVQPTQPASGASGDISLNYSGVARDVTRETVAAVPASADGPAFEVLPEYRRLTLQGYPNANHQSKPQIFIYPVIGLTSTNASAGKMVADLQALLQTRQAGAQMPFMPLPFSSKQAIDIQVQSLDFKGGTGVRFLTQFANGMAPVNNQQLIYSFQGLTSDGKYYVAAILPVINPKLPAGDQFEAGQAKMGQEYLDYLFKTSAMLSQQPADSFTPDLNKLDALVRSIEVK